MIQIEWRDSYSVRIKEIDEDHRILIRLFNDLANAMRQGKGKERLDQILMQLIGYTKLHFSREEKIMMAYKYGDYQAHKQIHDQLTEKVLQLYDQQKEEGFYLSVEVLFFLKNWLEEHILEKDMLLGAYLNKAGYGNQIIESDEKQL